MMKDADQATEERECAGCNRTVAVPEDHADWCMQRNVASTMCDHPDDERVPLSGDEWICVLCQEYVPAPAPLKAPEPVDTWHTRSQFAAAVDEAHAALHVWERQAGPGHPLHAEVTRAHEALHGVGAGLPRVACATLDPEAQRLHVALRATLHSRLPCGHALENIIYGGPDLNGLPAVAQCGTCLALRRDARALIPPTHGPVETEESALARLIERPLPPMRAEEAIAAQVLVCAGWQLRAPLKVQP